MNIEQKLKELYEMELPTPSKAAGIYSPCLRAGNTLYVSGQLPSYNGEIMFHGKLGENVSIEEGQQAARYCMLNVLSLVNAELGGFEKVKKFVQLLGYVQSTSDFHSQVQVINGASQMLHDLFGDAGLPTRMAIGTNAIPFDVPTEILAVIEIND